jgi:hypothetical protein
MKTIVSSPASTWFKKPTQRNIRHYAEHLALIVRQRGKLLTLSERYDDVGRLQEAKAWNLPIMGRGVASDPALPR